MGVLAVLLCAAATAVAAHMTPCPAGWVTDGETADRCLSLRHEPFELTDIFYFCSEAAAADAAASSLPPPSAAGAATDLSPARHGALLSLANSSSADNATLGLGGAIIDAVTGDVVWFDRSRPTEFKAWDAGALPLKLPTPQYPGVAAGCLGIDLATDHWTRLDCSARTAFVCEMQVGSGHSTPTPQVTPVPPNPGATAAPVATPVETPMPCQPGWTPSPSAGQCVRAVQGVDADGFTGNAACAALRFNAGLASTETQSQMVAVRRALAIATVKISGTIVSRSVTEPSFIGARFSRAMDMGEWGGPAARREVGMFRPWAEGEPSIPFGCVTVDDDGKWLLSRCDVSRPVVCSYINDGSQPETSGPSGAPTAPPEVTAAPGTTLSPAATEGPPPGPAVANPCFEGWALEPPRTGAVRLLGQRCIRSVQNPDVSGGNADAICRFSFAADQRALWRVRPRGYIPQVDVPGDASLFVSLSKAFAAVVATKDEADFAAGLISPPESQAVIGASFVRDGEFGSWFDGSLNWVSADARWGAGEPRHESGCVSMDSSGRWHSHHCRVPVPAVLCAYTPTDLKPTSTQAPTPAPKSQLPLNEWLGAIAGVQHLRVPSRTTGAYRVSTADGTSPSGLLMLFEPYGGDICQQSLIDPHAFLRRFKSAIFAVSDAAIVFPEHPGPTSSGRICVARPQDGTPPVFVEAKGLSFEVVDMHVARAQLRLLDLGAPAGKRRSDRDTEAIPLGQIGGHEAGVGTPGINISVPLGATGHVALFGDGLFPDDVAVANASRWPSVRFASSQRCNDAPFSLFAPVISVLPPPHTAHANEVGGAAGLVGFSHAAVQDSASWTGEVSPAGVIEQPRAFVLCVAVPGSVVFAATSIVASIPPLTVEVSRLSHVLRPDVAWSDTPTEAAGPVSDSVGNGTHVLLVGQYSAPLLRLDGVGLRSGMLLRLTTEATCAATEPSFVHGHDGRLVESRRDTGYVDLPMMRSEEDPKAMLVQLDRVHTAALGRRGRPGEWIEQLSVCVSFSATSLFFTSSLRVAIVKQGIATLAGETHLTLAAGFSGPIAVGGLETPGGRDAAAALDTVTASSVVGRLTADDFCRDSLVDMHLAIDPAATGTERAWFIVPTGPLSQPRTDLLTLCASYGALGNESEFVDTGVRVAVRAPELLQIANAFARVNDTFVSPRIVNVSSAEATRVPLVLGGSGLWDNSSVLLTLEPCLFPLPDEAWRLTLPVVPVGTSAGSGALGISGAALLEQSQIDVLTPARRAHPLFVCLATPAGSVVPTPFAVRIVDRRLDRSEFSLRIADSVLASPHPPYASTGTVYVRGVSLGGTRVVPAFDCSDRKSFAWPAAKVAVLRPDEDRETFEDPISGAGRWAVDVTEAETAHISPADAPPMQWCIAPPGQWRFQPTGVVYAIQQLEFNDGFRVGNAPAARRAALTRGDPAVLFFADAAVRTVKDAYVYLQSLDLPFLCGVRSSAVVQADRLASVHRGVLLLSERQTRQLPPGRYGLCFSAAERAELISSVDGEHRLRVRLFSRAGLLTVELKSEAPEVHSVNGSATVTVRQHTTSVLPVDGSRLAEGHKVRLSPLSTAGCVASLATSGIVVPDATLLRPVASNESQLFLSMAPPWSSAQAGEYQLCVAAIRSGEVKWLATAMRVNIAPSAVHTVTVGRLSASDSSFDAATRTLTLAIGSTAPRLLVTGEGMQPGAAIRFVPGTAACDLPVEGAILSPIDTISSVSPVQIPSTLTVREAGTFSVCARPSASAPFEAVASASEPSAVRAVVLRERLITSAIALPDSPQLRQRPLTYRLSGFGVPVGSAVAVVPVSVGCTRLIDASGLGDRKVPRGHVDIATYPVAAVWKDFTVRFSPQAFESTVVLGAFDLSPHVEGNLRWCVAQPSSPFAFSDAAGPPLSLADAATDAEAPLVESVETSQNGAVQVVRPRDAGARRLVESAVDITGLGALQRTGAVALTLHGAGFTLGQRFALVRRNGAAGESQCVRASGDAVVSTVSVDRVSRQGRMAAFRFDDADAVEAVAVATAMVELCVAPRAGNAFTAFGISTVVVLHLTHMETPTAIEALGASRLVTLAAGSSASFPATLAPEKNVSDLADQLFALVSPFSHCRHGRPSDVTATFFTAGTVPLVRFDAPAAATGDFQLCEGNVSTGIRVRIAAVSHVDGSQVVVAGALVPLQLFGPSLACGMRVSIVGAREVCPSQAAEKAATGMLDDDFAVWVRPPMTPGKARLCLSGVGQEATLYISPPDATAVVADAGTMLVAATGVGPGAQLGLGCSFVNGSLSVPVITTLRAAGKNHVAPLRAVFTDGNRAALLRALGNATEAPICLRRNPTMPWVWVSAKLSIGEAINEAPSVEVAGVDTPVAWPVNKVAVESVIHCRLFHVAAPEGTRLVLANGSTCEAPSGQQKSYVSATAEVSGGQAVLCPADGRKLPAGDASICAETRAGVFSSAGTMSLTPPTITRVEVDGGTDLRLSSVPPLEWRAEGLTVIVVPRSDTALLRVHGPGVRNPTAVGASPRIGVGARCDELHWSKSVVEGKALLSENATARLAGVASWPAALGTTSEDLLAATVPLCASIDGVHYRPIAGVRLLVVNATDFATGSRNSIAVSLNTSGFVNLRRFVLPAGQQMFPDGSLVLLSSDCLFSAEGLPRGHVFQGSIAVVREFHTLVPQDRLKVCVRRRVTLNLGGQIVAGFASAGFIDSGVTFSVVPLRLESLNRGSQAALLPLGRPAVVPLGVNGSNARRLELRLERECSELTADRQRLVVASALGAGYVVALSAVDVGLLPAQEALNLCVSVDGGATFMSTGFSVFAAGPDGSRPVLRSATRSSRSEILLQRGLAAAASLVDERFLLRGANSTLEPTERELDVSLQLSAAVWDGPVAGGGFIRGGRLLLPASVSLTRASAFELRFNGRRIISASSAVVTARVVQPWIPCFDGITHRQLFVFARAAGRGIATWDACRSPGDESTAAPVPTASLANRPAASFPVVVQTDPCGMPGAQSIVTLRVGRGGVLPLPHSIQLLQAGVEHWLCAVIAGDAPVAPRMVVSSSVDLRTVGDGHRVLAVQTQRLVVAADGAGVSQGLLVRFVLPKMRCNDPAEGGSTLDGGFAFPVRNSAIHLASYDTARPTTAEPGHAVPLAPRRVCFTADGLVFRELQGVRLAVVPPVATGFLRSANTGLLFVDEARVFRGLVAAPPLPPRHRAAEEEEDEEEEETVDEERPPRAELEIARRPLVCPGGGACQSTNTSAPLMPPSVSFLSPGVAGTPAVDFGPFPGGLSDTVVRIVATDALSGSSAHHHHAHEEHEERVERHIKRSGCGGLTSDELRRRGGGALEFLVDAATGELVDWASTIRQQNTSASAAWRRASHDSSLRLCVTPRTGGWPPAYYDVDDLRPLLPLLSVKGAEADPLDAVINATGAQLQLVPEAAVALRNDDVLAITLFFRGGPNATVWAAREAELASDQVRVACQGALSAPEVFLGSGQPSVVPPGTTLAVQLWTDGGAAEEETATMVAKAMMAKLDGGWRVAPCVAGQCLWPVAAAVMFPDGTVVETLGARPLFAPVRSLLPAIPNGTEALVWTETPVTLDSTFVGEPREGGHPSPVYAVAVLSMVPIIVVYALYRCWLLHCNPADVEVERIDATMAAADEKKSAERRPSQAPSLLRAVKTPPRRNTGVTLAK